MAVDKSLFEKIVDLVIQNNEGGYFSREMLLDGRANDPKGLMSAGPGRVDSGETMYGIDRVNGYELRAGDPAAWDEFWSIMDKANARNTWKHYYLGGSEAPRLRKLAADIMYPKYKKLSTLYLSTLAIPIVDSDPVLTYHFAYATWNGSGFFKSFASDFNKAVSSGGSMSDLIDKALSSRTDSSNALIRQGGANLVKALPKIQSVQGFEDSKKK